MNNQDVRWQQRFSNYQEALNNLRKFMAKDQLNELEEQGLIQAFEYNHELAWKTLADFLISKGNNQIYGSKDATRAAFSLGLIQNGEIWMEMIISRNMTSHTYKKSTTQKILTAIKSDYYQEFLNLEKKLTELVKLTEPAI